MTYGCTKHVHRLIRKEICTFGRPKKFAHFAGCEIKRMRPAFKAIMLIYRSKANLDPEITKILVKGMLGLRIPYSIKPQFDARL